MLDQWLRFAPTPAALQPSRRFHVFLSYRSVNRAWVLQLYDVLRSLGYEVFLDQYVLAAAAPLASSLGEALAASQSAVLIWSPEFEDSAWCKKEYDALEAKEAAGKGFRFVIAKVHTGDLLDLAAGKIHVDFSGDPDGPSGGNLLRLLHGLQGNPLPPEAVKLAAKVDDEHKAARVAIRAARMNGQADRLVALSKLETLAWLTGPALGCEVADALIAMKRNDEALEVLARVEARFPRALRPKQLQGLALARKGDWEAAQSVLGGLYAAGEIDPETLGIYARTWMDRYTAMGHRLFLLKSRDLYRQAFEAAPTDYYTGINAATKSLLLGEKETAAQLAARVEQIVGKAAVPKDYWKTATVAEVQLLQQNFAAAAQRYLDAVADSPEEHGSHLSTRGQAAKVLDALGAPDDARALVLGAFDHPGCAT